MNNSTAVFLINDKVRAILATYEAGDNAAKAFFKSFDPTLKVGDLVNVVSNTRHNVTVVKITDVDVEFDISTTTKFEWIISKVDMEPHIKMLAMENDALAAIASAEKHRKREELKKALFADAEAKLATMALAKLDSAPALEAQE